MKRPASERTKQVNIRLTADEAAALVQSAADANMDLAAFVRRRALERVAKPDARRVMSAHTSAIVRELSAIATALQRIVRLYEVDDADARRRLETCLTDAQAAMLSLRR
jgi:uncharacterized protein (DUF1778 family)